MKILIAEDDFVSRTLLQEMLQPYGTCHLAANGEEAVRAFASMLERHTPYNLICLDIMMPGMNGQEALKQIREMEQQRGIGGKDAVRIIMVSALDDPKNIMQALVRGPCDGYLTKPLDQGKMIKLLADLGISPLGPGNTAAADFRTP